MTTQRLILSLLGFTVILASPHSSSKAEAADPSSLEKQKTSVATSPSLLTIDFPGGTISNFVARAAAASSAEPLNVMGEKAEMETLLPPFSLRNADPSAVVSALGLLLSQRGLMLVPAGAPPNIVYTLTKLDPSATQMTAFESFQIGPKLKRQSIDDIVAAIRLAWQLNPAHDDKALILKYHPPTSLLLVSGSPAAVRVAKLVIQTLAPETLQPPSPTAPPEKSLAPTLPQPSKEPKQE